MANIKNLQMWKTICADARVSVSTSFFGLKTSAVYRPTNSPIEANIFEFAQADGLQLQHILTSRKPLSEALGNFVPTPTTNGNYMAEVCTSQDGAFAAVQLLQFEQLGYEPVTDVLIFEGDDALRLQHIF